jgi:hypothetical protein
MSLTYKQKAFLAAYVDCGNLTAAAAATKIQRQTHYDWLEGNEYALAFAESKEMAGELLEKEARRRAAEGIKRLKFNQGQVITVPTGDWQCPVGHVGPKGERGAGVWECPLCELPQEPVMTPYIEHEYSDTLLIFLLKGAMPNKYKDRVQHEFSSLTDDELRQRAARLFGRDASPGSEV